MLLLSPVALKGTPDAQVRLARLMMEFGRTVEALALGYETVSTNREDRQASLLYLGLLLPDPRGKRIPTTSDDVRIDSWVAVERDDGKRLEIVIEAGLDRPHFDHYSPNHPLAKMVLDRA